MNRNLSSFLILALWIHAATAFGQEAWLGRVPAFRAICSPQALDSEDPDPAVWTALRESLPEEEAANIGAWLTLPAEAPSPAASNAEPDKAASGETGAAEAPEAAAAEGLAAEGPGRVPCAQYFGGAPLPADVIARTVPGGPALFAYCPGASSAPCYARLRELLEASHAAAIRLVWSRAVLGWVDDEGRAYAEPQPDELEAAAAVRELVREPPDSDALLGPVGFVVVAHLDEGEVLEITRALDPPPEGEGGG